MTDNTWCDAIGVTAPRLDLVKDHREANICGVLPNN